MTTTAEPDRTAPGPLSPDAPVPAASGRPDHYQGLDLLRGVAALAVVLYHFSERLDLPLLFDHGYLAVDFFFALSGFVLASAYGRRLADGRLGTGRFYALRLARLMPLVALGTLASFVVEFWRPGVTDPATHAREAVAALVLGCLLLPTPFVSTLQHTLFPLDGPVWSLFFEAVANALLPPWARSRAPRALLAVTVLACGAALAWTIARAGTVHVGFRQEDALAGLPRVGFSFGVGLALFGLRSHLRVVPLALPALALAAILCVPPLGPWQPAFEALCVFALLPAVTFAAAGARCGRVGRRLAAVAGDLSYPVYALHFPVMRAVTVVASRHELGTAGRVGVAVGATVAIVALSAAAYVLYDAPVRRRLARLAAPRVPA